MEAVFVSSYCSKEVYFSLLKPDCHSSQQYQKYMRLIATGLSKNGVKVSSIAYPPVNSYNTKKHFICLKK